MLQHEIEQLKLQQAALERELVEIDAATAGAADHSHLPQGTIADDAQMVRGSITARMQEIEEIRQRYQRDANRALRAYFKAVSGFPRYQENRERQLRGARGFSFEARELQKAQRIRTRRMEEEAQERERELQRVLRHRFRANPVPPSTYMNKYDLMLEEWRQRKAAVEALAVEKAERMREEAQFIRASVATVRPAREVMCVRQSERQRAQSAEAGDRRRVVELHEAPIEVKLRLWPAIEEDEQVRKERIKQRAVVRLHEVHAEEERRAAAVAAAMHTQPSVLGIGPIPSLAVPIAEPMAPIAASTVPGAVPVAASTVPGAVPVAASTVPGALRATYTVPGALRATYTVPGKMPTAVSTIPGAVPPSAAIPGAIPAAAAIPGKMPTAVSTIPGAIPPSESAISKKMPTATSTITGKMPSSCIPAQGAAAVPGTVPPPPSTPVDAVPTVSHDVEKLAAKRASATQSGEGKKRKEDDMAILRKFNPNLLFKPNIRAGVPNFDELWNKERLALAERKRTKLPTEVKPFDLTASAKDEIVRGRRPSPQSRFVSAPRRCKSVDIPISNAEPRKVRPPIPKGTRAHAVRTRAAYNKYINVHEDKEREESDELLILQEASRKQRAVNSRLKGYLRDTRVNNDAVIREKVKVLHQHSRELEREAADRLKEMKERVAQIPPIFVEPTHLQDAAKERAQAEVEVLQMLTESGVDSNTISAILRASGDDKDAVEAPENEGATEKEGKDTTEKEKEIAEEGKAEPLPAPKEENAEQSSDRVSSISASTSTVSTISVATAPKEKGEYDDDDFEDSFSSSSST